MKSIQILNYSDALKSVMNNLVFNEKLINVFIRIVFNKTNLFKVNEITLCLDLI